MSGAEVKRASVRYTLSLAQKIGQVIRTSRSKKQDPFPALTHFMAATSYSVAQQIFYRQDRGRELSNQNGVSRRCRSRVLTLLE